MEKLRRRSIPVFGRLLIGMLVLGFLASGPAFAGEIYGTYSLVNKGGFVIFNKHYNAFSAKWKKNDAMFTSPKYALVQKMDKHRRYIARIDYTNPPEYLVPRQTIDQNKMQKNDQEVYAICSLKGNRAIHMFGREYGMGFPVWQKKSLFGKPVHYKLVKDGEKIKLVHVDRVPANDQNVYASKGDLISYY